MSLNQVELVGDGDVDDIVIAAHELTYVHDVLSRLPDDYQTVIRLRILEERPTDEVAMLMRRSPGAVRVIQHRAIVALRAEFDKESRP